MAMKKKRKEEKKKNFWLTASLAPELRLMMMMRDKLVETNKLPDT